MQLSVTLVSPNGPMLPLTTTFGWGSALGVENDLSVKGWSVLNENGLRSSSNYPYLSSGELVNVEVVLGFEGTQDGTPRLRSGPGALDGGRKRIRFHFNS